MQWLTTEDQEHRYSLVNASIPVLLDDPLATSRYLANSVRMIEEYSLGNVNAGRSMLNALKRLLNSDYRTDSSVRGFNSIFSGLPDDALCISIGGGPVRAHKRLTNVNIGRFPNVDVVADAHQLPYADGCVDAVHSDAVFEHLHSPHIAATEIFRVLKPGKRVYACVPFLFPYHGYPNHYQNFTLDGHKQLFESVGLNIVDSGCCVGPVFTVTNLINVFIREYSPRILRLPLRIVWAGIGVTVRPLDKLLAKRRNAHLLAATTYVVAEKPNFSDVSIVPKAEC